MDQDWLYNLTQDTAVIVPTRSLANSVIEHHSHYQIEQGASVWEAPRILLWQDYLQQLWQVNREQLIQALGVHSLISEQQCLLLWTQVIEASRRRESALTLLDVKQTARAVQRAWRLLHDWRLSEQDLRRDHVADIDQFLEWLDAYRALMKKRGLIDIVGLQQLVLQLDLQWPFTHLHWHCYDLLTAAQQEHNRLAAKGGVTVQIAAAGQVCCEQTSHHVYANDKAELIGALQTARKELEADPGLRINLVIPDLARRHKQVRELARDIFYPALSPRALMHQPSAYRFSLGEALSEWPAIETALRVIKLLHNRCMVTDLCFILRNRYLAVARQHRAECRAFEQWLQRQRLRFVLIDQLPELYAQCRAQAGEAADPSPFTEVLAQMVEQRRALAAKLRQQQHDNDFAALNFAEWVKQFNGWLQLWGWHPASDQQAMDSVQYQLWQRWQRLLDEFRALGIVQRHAGLTRAIELLDQIARDAAFLPKAVASPIFISGIYEAIGQPADLTLLTGMSDRYPAAPLDDAFVPNRLLLDCGYPDASAVTAYTQVQQVLQSLLRFSKGVRISFAHYATRDQEVASQPSPLFRNVSFQPDQAEPMAKKPVVLDQYEDTRGPEWEDVKRARGGAQIFVNQSQCAFKAFATHQLQYQSEEEAEFGLDPRERGTVVHRMLQLAWQELGSQTALLALDDNARRVLAGRVAAAAIADPGISLNADKQRLLECEQQRLMALLMSWFAVEVKRPQDFQVVETEQAYDGELHDISFRFKIDRLDVCADGRPLLVDYKTGSTARTDWLGERIRQPQLPLYALQLDSRKQTPLAGIAYAGVKQPDAGYVVLGEGGLVNKGTEKNEREWQQARKQWPQSLAQLAADFKQGVAAVNPIDEVVCQYCDLKPLCRVAQLKQLALEGGDVD